MRLSADTQQKKALSQKKLFAHLLLRKSMSAQLKKALSLEKQKSKHRQMDEKRRSRFAKRLMTCSCP